MCSWLALSGFTDGEESNVLVRGSIMEVMEVEVRMSGLAELTKCGRDRTSRIMADRGTCVGGGGGTQARAEGGRLVGMVVGGEKRAARWHARRDHAPFDLGVKVVRAGAVAGAQSPGMLVDKG